ncbi:spore coat protein [Geobacillus genomosp. 3]|uniref:Spore coat protein n=1 Tax=Geobacillus genomosp. 3 TaxID=1921421 RepID=S5Z2E5_GEOG3|nr:CotS family spore coat protein [Geobacillus genomosp. 3]AGT31162.1 spore coat protein [Geobacillus genomosp. 3]
MADQTIYSTAPPAANERLIHMARLLLKQWDVEARAIDVVQSGQMALVWKVHTDDGPKCLKRIHRPEKKALFSIYAQDVLAKKGLYVPRIIKTRDHRLFKKYGPFLFVLYDWIEGTPFDLTVRDDLTAMINALAHFHVQSTGYEPPPGVPVFSKLGKWPKHYMKRCRQLEAWKQLAALDRDDPFSRLYLEEIDRFIERGEEVLQQLLESHYEAWVEQLKKRPSLCHQDYGTGNSLRGEDGNVWIIDLDTAAFDLPIRDVRKMMAPLLFETDRQGKAKADMVLEAYEAVRPLATKEKKVLFIDLLFPYDLHELAVEKYIRNVPLAEAELAETMAYEQTKWEEISRRLASL